MLLLSACAGTRRDSPSRSSASETASASGCRPFFISPYNESPESVPNHSCWHRLWEVPAAIVVVPAAIGLIVGIGTAPVWVPLVLLN